ncbi:hypothetical protein FACS1894106_2600 [Spirochaetia bacterium]|nr:hypothetical protein FACS1894106_2600 [Spirochaetia bacterium]
MKANVGDRVILECKEDEVFIVSRSLNGGLKIETALYWCNDPRPDMIVEKELQIVHRGYTEVKKEPKPEPWKEIPINPCSCGEVPELCHITQPVDARARLPPFQVVCPHCNKQGIPQDTEIKAIESWNSFYNKGAKQ